MSLVKSSRGHRVDESDLGSFLRRVKSLQGHGRAVILGEEKIGNREVIPVEVEGEEGFALEGVHRYLVWLDKRLLLPLKTSAYDGGGKLVEEVLMDDLEVNVPLDESLFRF